MMVSRKSPEKLIALTGATGFVGGHIMRGALKAGHRVRALTRRPVPEIENVEWVKGDLANEQALSALFDRADAFIHTAGLVKARSEADFFTVNTAAVSKILKLGGKAKTSENFHFILVSSLAARHPELSPYAKSKRGGEQALAKAAPDFPFTIVRPPAVYGPGDKEILKLFKAMKRGFAPVAGDDENVFSLVHVRDLAGAILCALHHEPAFGATLEPDDGKKSGYTIKDVARVAEKVLERKITTLEIPGPVLHLFAAANEMFARFGSEPAILSRHKVRELVHPNWVSDQTSKRKIAHWDPEIDLETGFRETVAWYRENNLL